MTDIITPEIIDLVVARLKAIPPDVHISIGSEGTFDIKELIKRVQNGDEVGKKIIEMHLRHLRALKDLPLPERETPNYAPAV